MQTCLRQSSKTNKFARLRVQQLSTPEANPTRFAATSAV